MKNKFFTLLRKGMVIKMNISIGILIMELENRFNFVTNIENSVDYPIKLFQIWDGSKPEYDILYIVNQEQITANPGIWCNHFIIGYDLDPQKLKPTGLKWINLENEQSFHPIINELQKILNKFYNWIRRVEEISYTSYSIHTLLNDLENTYSLMSMLVTRNLKYLTASTNFPKYNSWIDDKNCMPLDLFNELLSDEEFRNAQNYNEAFVYYSTISKSDAYSYCYNIKIEKEYRARLLVHCKSYSKSFGILYLTEYLGRKLTEIMKNHNFQDDAIYANTVFKEMVADMLSGIHKSSIEIKECLKELKWEQKHTYQVYLFQLFRNEIPNTTHVYYRTQLELFLGECYVIEENNKFVCLINLSLTPSYKHNDQQSLSIFLRDNLCKVGISNEFHDLSELNEYYKEADIALFIGSIYNSTAWQYHFCDMILPYLKHQITKGINAEHLIHPAIKVLQEYDRRENTQLVKTIETFLYHKYNVTHTAEKLFIHRTSLLVRLERIKQLTGVTFDDYNERIHLILSLLLL